MVPETQAAADKWFSKSQRSSILECSLYFRLQFLQTHDIRGFQLLVVDGSSSSSTVACKTDHARELHRDISCPLHHVMLDGIARLVEIHQRPSLELPDGHISKGSGQSATYGDRFHSPDQTLKQQTNLQA